MKILIVEDDPSMIELYRVWLKTTKAEVDYCDNSFKVANKILNGEIRDYDLLIVDLKLEGSKDGDKVVDLLRDIGPHFCHLVGKRASKSAKGKN